MSPPLEDEAERLYLVTRSDLSAGYQATQSAHVIAEFCVTHPTEARRWKEAGGWLITLSVPDLEALVALADRLEYAGHFPVRFAEADLNEEITAIACPPAPGIRAQLAALPLALGHLDPVANAQAKKRERALREEVRLD